MTINFTNGTHYTTPSIRGETGADGTKDVKYYFCISGEYDPISKVPTIENPDTSTLYVVPNGNTFNAFCYKNEWVLFQNASITSRAILG